MRCRIFSFSKRKAIASIIINVLLSQVGDDPSTSAIDLTSLASCFQSHFLSSNPPVVERCHFSRNHSISIFSCASRPSQTEVSRLCFARLDFRATSTSGMLSYRASQSSSRSMTVFKTCSCRMIWLSRQVFHRLCGLTSFARNECYGYLYLSGSGQAKILKDASTVITNNVIAKMT